MYNLVLVCQFQRSQLLEKIRPRNDLLTYYVDVVQEFASQSEGGAAGADVECLA